MIVSQQSGQEINKSIVETYEHGSTDEKEFVFLPDAIRCATRRNVLPLLTGIASHLAAIKKKHTDTKIRFGGNFEWLRTTKWDIEGIDPQAQLHRPAHWSNKRRGEIEVRRLHRQVEGDSDYRNSRRTAQHRNGSTIFQHQLIMRR